jgi:hypothetical protein
MNNAEFNAVCQLAGEKFTELYADLCQRFPKKVVLTAITGALAACATEAEQPRDRVIAVLNSCFDDIESEDEEDE